MAYNGSEGEIVSVDDAARWTENYRNANPGAFKAHYIGKTHLGDILKQPGCMGIKMYLAIDDDGSWCMVAVGVDANEKDMTSGLIAERGYGCPPYCDNTSVLNG